MPAIQPATIADRIFTQINQAMAIMTRFYAPTDFVILRWQDELAKLAQADAVEAAIGLAMVAHMMGDLEAVDRYMDQAQDLGGATPRLGLSRLLAYANLGFASKAQTLFCEYIDIKYHNIGELGHVGSGIGAFQQVAKLMKQAELAKLQLNNGAMLAGLSQAAATLAIWPVSDAQCAQVIDAAGEVMREHRLFWKDTAPQIFTNPEDAVVSMTLRVDTTPEQASLMSMETIDKLILRDLDRLPFLISFMGTQQ